MTKKPVNSAPFESPFDQAKYNFTKRLTLIVAITLFGLSFAYFFQNDLFFWPVIAGSLFAFITYVILMRTNNIKVSGVFALLSMNIVIITKLLIESHFHYFEDFFWIICLTVFAFFVLGKWYGIITFSVNIILAYILLHLLHNTNFQLIERPYRAFDEVSFALSLIVGAFIFISIMLELLKQNKLSEKQYTSTHKELAIQYEEKSIMLKEIHHRVKNNLQIITSLLRLQANEAGDKEPSEIFSDSINRISAIAKIHDRMYNHESLNQINLKTYLSDLINDLVLSYKNEQVIDSEVHSNVKNLHPKHLVPIALIFNELVTNSVKHAFKNAAHGIIRVEAKNESPEVLTLIYHDNGTWVEPKALSTHMGLDLIDSFVSQLDGTLEILKTNGTTFIIRVNLDENAVD